MITEFNIQNYKSIEDINIKLGRVNVFIGENGCGKSNILESLVIASAAIEDKLDNEFLTSRGVRVTRPEIMRSAFDLKNTEKPINFEFKNNNSIFKYSITNDNKPYSKWNKVSLNNNVNKDLEKLTNELAKKYIDEKNDLVKQIVLLSNINNDKKKSDLEIVKDFLKNIIDEIPKNFFNNFIIYSPENTSLRTFEKEGQIEPLGIYGEGLFKLLKYFASEENENENINKIKSYLSFFGWFEDFMIPEKLFEGESYLKIKDKFIDKKIDFIDQRSSNEGFLFILFYISLFLSKKTPAFFAIDNIESSLNPKLATKLVKCISELSKENNKQVILTSHSPSILDGLDLNDNEQKLFLIYRNRTGKTCIKEIEKPKLIEGQEPVKLSEAFLRGYIGGLPKNFNL